MKTLKDFNVKNKRVLVRCDFNVPLDDKGIIQDDFRIKQALSTIQFLAENEAKVVLMSHLGRPQGEVAESLRLTPVQKKLEEYLGFSVVKTSDCIGKEAEKQVKKMKSGQVLLLENLRFHKEEENNEPEFAQKLAKLGDIYINDAFSVSHRSHASVSAIVQYLPSGAGFLLEKEVKVLSRILENPKRPLIIIIGGLKIEDKIGVIDRFKQMADYLLIGGRVAEIFILPNFSEKNLEGQAPNTPKNPNVPNLPNNIYLPIDGIKDNGLVLDIGPKTIDKFSKIIEQGETIFWAGPMGKFEEPLYENGTRKIAEAIVNNNKAYKIAGGGDTISAIAKLGLRGKFDHISTGGGAMLDFLSGKELPGLKVLE